jgi:AbiTii
LIDITGENWGNSTMGDTAKIIKQIQDDILSQQTGLESILLKAKVLAHYLGNDDFKKWVKNELDGYTLDSCPANELPDYRIKDSIIIGTFSNGVYIQKNTTIAVNNFAPELRDILSKMLISQGVTSLEELAKKEQVSAPLPRELINEYNRLNAKSLSQGYYQLMEAYRPITGAGISQILGTIRSRLQDFILEISSNWDIDSGKIPVERVDKIFQFTIINNHAGKVSMSDFGKDGDTYNVGQAGAVGKYARSDSNTFVKSEPRQTLVETASEIQKLLEYFEQTNPSATQSEMISYVNDETTPSLKRRASAALTACGESIFDEFVLDNKYHKVIKATVKGWLQAGG